MFRCGPGCLYVYIRRYAYICMYGCMCGYTYGSVYVCMYLHMYLYTFTCVDRYVCMCRSLHLIYLRILNTLVLGSYLYICMYVCIYVYIYICVYICIYAYMCVRTHIGTHGYRYACGAPPLGCPLNIFSDPRRGCYMVLHMFIFFFFSATFVRAISLEPLLAETPN